MATTKYIVDNASDQTIDGNLNITGTTNIKPYKVYTALLTQSGGDSTVDITSGSLTVGVTYWITSGSDGDFTNVGAPNNNTDTYFVATGDVPSSWGTSGSLRYNEGSPVVKVLENTIGNIWFNYEDVGVYGCQSNDLFTTDKTFLLLTNPNVGNGVVATANYIDINSMAIVFYDNASPYETLDNALENTPIEIRVYN
jgi:hypothetical protein